MTEVVRNETAGPGHRLDAGVLMLVLLAQFCIFAAVGTVNVALPAMGQELQATASELQWILLAFQLGFALLLITGGRLGDIHGARTVFLWGFAGFVMGNALAVVAPSPVVLIVARLLQGVSGGLAAPQVLGMIQVMATGAQRGRAIAAFAAISGSAFAIGQVVTGVLIRGDVWGLGWRAAFLVYLPIGVLVLALSRRALPNPGTRRGDRVDVRGLLLLSVGGLLLLVPLVQGHDRGWPSHYVLVLVAAVGVLSLLVHEQRRRHDGHDVSTLLDIALFRITSFRTGLLVVGGISSMALGQVVYLTVGLQAALGLDAFSTAVATAPFPTTYVLVSSFSTRASERLGRRTVAVASVLVAAPTLAIVLMVDADGIVSVPVIMPLLAVLGCGYGLSQAPMMTFALSEIPPRQASASSGMLQTAQQLGSVFGVALLGIVYFAERTGTTTAGGALRDTMGAVLLLATLLFLSQFVLPPDFARRQHDVADPTRQSVS